MYLPLDLPLYTGKGGRRLVDGRKAEESRVGIFWNGHGMAKKGHLST